MRTVLSMAAVLTLAVSCCGAARLLRVASVDLPQPYPLLYSQPWVNAGLYSQKTGLYSQLESAAAPAAPADKVVSLSELRSDSGSEALHLHQPLHSPALHQPLHSPTFLTPLHSPTLVSPLHGEEGSSPGFPTPGLGGISSLHGQGEGEVVPPLPPGQEGVVLFIRPTLVQLPAPTPPGRAAPLSHIFVSV